MIRTDQIEMYLRKPPIRNWLEVLAAFVLMRLCVRAPGFIFAIPPLAHWLRNHPAGLPVLSFVFLAPMVLLFISVASGWWGLSLTYTTERPAPVNRRTGSAGFRYVFGYNNVLRLGSDSEGLFISSWVRLFHPPLFIPWRDIEVGQPKRMLFQRYRTLKLGAANQVPCSIDGKTVDRLLAGRAKSNIAE